jgi:hypothetical protein
MPVSLDIAKGAIDTHYEINSRNYRYSSGNKDVRQITKAADVA